MEGQEPGQAAAGRVVVDRVTKIFDDTAAVKEVSLGIEPGEFLTLLGPSGCGKTTLLRMIAGFERPTRGRILIGGEDMTQEAPEHRPVNMVFQRYALFPHLNVAGNVAYGLEAKAMDRKTIDQRVADALDLAAMTDFAARPVRQLSGGQQQRVALARALVNQPEVLLLDEPLAALDLQLRKRMQLELRSIHRRLGTTFVYVTHDQGEALTMSDRVVVMDHGVIAQTGTPEVIYRAPENRFVASFVGEGSFVPCHVDGAGDGVAKVTPLGAGKSIEVATSASAPRSGPAVLLVRPEVVSLTDPAEALLTGRLDDVMFTGAVYRCIVVLPNGTEVKADLARLEGLSRGDEVGLDWPPRDAVVLGAES